MSQIVIPVRRPARRAQSGQAFVEYAVILAAIVVVGIAAFSVLGHKANDLVGTLAVILPGAHTEDNAPIYAGQLIETSTSGNTAGGLGVSSADVLAGTGTSRLNNNLGIDPAVDLVVD